MFASNCSSQRTTLVTLFLAVTMALSVAACGGGGGGGATVAAGAAAPAPAPEPAPVSQLALSLATPTYAVGTITFTAATVTRESKNGDTFSNNLPYCAITVSNAVNGANQYEVRVFFLKTGGTVFNASVFDQRFNLPVTFGGYAINPPAAQISVEPLLKYINFSNAIVLDAGFGTSATVNGRLYFGVANSTDVCGL